MADWNKNVQALEDIKADAEMAIRALARAQKSAIALGATLNYFYPSDSSNPLLIKIDLSITV